MKKNLITPLAIGATLGAMAFSALAHDSAEGVPHGHDDIDVQCVKWDIQSYNNDGTPRSYKWQNNCKEDVFLSFCYRESGGPDPSRIGKFSCDPQLYYMAWIDGKREFIAYALPAGHRTQNTQVIRGAHKPDVIIWKACKAGNNSSKELQHAVDHCELLEDRNSRSRRITIGNGIYKRFITEAEIRALDKG